VLGDQIVVLSACTLLVLLGGSGEVVLAWMLAATVSAGGYILAEHAAHPAADGAGAGRRAGPRIWARLALMSCSVLLLIGCVSPTALSGAPACAYVLSRAQVGPLARAVERLLALPAVAWLVLVLTRAYRFADEGASVPAAYVLASAVAVALAALLGARTAQAEASLADLHRVRDDLQEKVRALSVSRARLLSAQDSASRAAVLDERTRIAREIHDGVGHQLTRLLFQVRALEVVHRDDPGLVGELGAVGAGVGQALDAMRSSVHALSDDAEDLATGLHVLAVRGPVEDVSVRCEVGQDLPAEVSRCLVAVVREALTNAARHGRARQARVSVAEYPGFWRAVVTNDGLPAESAAADDGGVVEGMGLRSMRERVEALGGTLWVSGAPRFRVQATVPRPNAPTGPHVPTSTAPKEPR